jgi:tRNA(Ile2) C34 agmatinyltransferase TiaS
VIFVGLDDTDVIDSPGTNQLAKRLAARLSDRFHCRWILRHQLLIDDRVPYTSKNGSAALVLVPQATQPPDVDALFDEVAHVVRSMAAPGSDPGLCMGQRIATAVTAFGLRCKTTLCTRAEAHQVARNHGLRLAGLGGSHDGVIGALAAVGLAASGDDGRVVLLDGRDDLGGWSRVEELDRLGVEVRCAASGQRVARGAIDVGKHLRPNLRQGKIVQYAEPDRDEHALLDRWKAIRLP